MGTSSLPWCTTTPVRCPEPRKDHSAFSFQEGMLPIHPGTSDPTQENSRELAREEIPSRDFSTFSARSSVPLLVSSHLLENSVKTFLASVQKSLL